MVTRGRTRSEVAKRVGKEVVWREGGGEERGDHKRPPVEGYIGQEGKKR